MIVSMSFRRERVDKNKNSEDKFQQESALHMQQPLDIIGRTLVEVKMCE